MADRTLIQGAKELAASRATSGIGAAMAAGFIGVQERTAAKNAAINEQGRKEAEAIKARSAKNMSGWKGLGDLDQGIFPEAQQKEIRKTVFGIKDKFSKVATALAHDPTNLDLMEERDGYFTRLQSNMELSLRVHGQKAAVLSHSFGDTVFRYFLSWVSSPLGGEWHRRCCPSMSAVLFI